jgi:hypothetical protein
MKKRLFALLIIILTISCNNNELTDSGEIPVKGTDTYSRLGITRQKDSLITALTEMKAEKLDCSAEAYWKIIQQGEEAIPVLIECLTDNSPTAVYNACKKGKLTAGEVCYFALEELADFPTAAITQHQFDLVINDCWSFYDYLFDGKNKNDYQKKVRNFYNTNRNTRYKFKAFTKKELTPCRKMYKIEGRLVWNG